MTTPGSDLDPDTEAAIDRALDAAQLRTGDTTAVVIHPEPFDVTVDDGGDGD
ncbi:hypothetical protein ACU045_07815 [Microbacterium sp. MAHUQ-60]|uniref:hypothetical protein n=1 Tax=unclassified Microbacterium TaxID=2609290 RepID=UPI0036219FB6